MARWYSSRHIQVTIPAAVCFFSNKIVIVIKIFLPFAFLQYYLSTGMLMNE